MSESFSGTISVLILFIICLLLGFIVVYVKNYYVGNKKCVNKPPEIFYVSTRQKTKRKTKKRSPTPLNVTIVDKDDLKKLLEK